MCLGSNAVFVLTYIPVKSVKIDLSFQHFCLSFFTLRFQVPLFSSKENLISLFDGRGIAAFFVYLQLCKKTERMRNILILLFVGMTCFCAASPTDDTVRRECLQSLARFMAYARSIYTDAGISSRGDSIGYFKALDAGKSTEDGVRTNADMAMVAAYVYEMGRTEDIHLPGSLTFPQLRHMAIRAFRYALATHRANRLAACTDGRYWGSEQGEWKQTGGKWDVEKGKWQWESSLWALSVALAGEFIDQGWGLTTYDRHQLERLLASEADFQLNRPVPTGWQGDTKAEENGWESNVLAAAVAFCPQHPHAAEWRQAMLRFGLNCYTVPADAKVKTQVAGRAVSEWYAGANLFPDFTLQNHGYFHASYQNVVMQEQAENTGSKKWQSARDALTWHWGDVWQKVLSQLGLCDGELAMPNGNDWSMFLYDQLPAYAAMATIGRNSDALLLEQRCLQSLLARQATTKDGSYMLNPDIGPRRMGVTAHRVMMTALMHELFPTDGMRPTTWDQFRRRHGKAMVMPHQNLVRSMTASRFASFSWSEGLKNCSAIIVPDKVEHSKIFVPFGTAADHAAEAHLHRRLYGVGGIRLWPPCLLYLGDTRQRCHRHRRREYAGCRDDGGESGPDDFRKTHTELCGREESYCRREQAVAF